jgi:hypothetical protein
MTPGMPGGTPGSVLAARDQIKVGQTIADVHALVGEPDYVRNLHFHASSRVRQVRDTWKDQNGYFEVCYEGGIVVSFEHRQLMQQQAPVPTKISREKINLGGVADKVISVAVSGYFSWACPAVYRKSLLFMTANDVQLLQQCNANGFMLFGMYVYTGALTYT